MERLIEWDQKKIIDFFKSHSWKDITLQESGSSFKIQGKLENFQEIDLCSHTLFEAFIKPKFFEEEIYITLHNKFIGIEINRLTKKSGLSLKKKPFKIKYKKLKIFVKS